MPGRSNKKEKAPIGLHHLSYYLAPKVITVGELAERIGLSEGAVKTYSEARGLKYVHVAEGESACDISLRVARQALEESDTDPLEIDALILYHSLYNVTLPPISLVSRIQHELGLARSIGFSISQQNCASINTAIRVARNMILSGSAKTVLIAGADSVEESRAREIKHIGLLSDGGGAVIVKEGSARNRLVEITNFVEGCFYDYLNWQKEDFEKYNLAYFVATTRIINRTLRRAKLNLDALSLLIPHNINASSWGRIVEMLKIDDSKLFGENIQQHSHSFGTDIIINLHDAISRGRLREGEYALLATAGLGACWGCVLIQH